MNYDLLQPVHKSTAYCATTCYNLFISPLITDLLPVKTCSYIHSILLYTTCYNLLMSPLLTVPRPVLSTPYCSTTCYNLFISTLCPAIIPALHMACYICSTWFVRSWLVTASPPHAFPMNCYTLLMSPIYSLSMTW
jgi:hypothetical protein